MRAMSGIAAGAPLRSAEFVPLVALLISLVALAIDAMLPALPAIGHDLGLLHRNDAQFVITSLFVGLGIGQVLFGPLSDSVGRRPAIQAGLAVFMIGSLVSVLASSFEAMIAGRVLQGVGAAGPRVVTLALVRDQYKGRHMARLMSFVMAVFIVVPAVAPLLGQGLMWLGGWRTIFATFFAIAAVALAWFTLRQPETLPSERQQSFSLLAIGRAVTEILRNRTTLGYTLAAGFVFAPFVAYLSSAQQIFQEAYDTGALFPVYFGALALAIGFSAFTNGRLVMRHGMRRLSKIGARSVALISVLAWTITFACDGLPPLWFFMAYLLAVFLCLGLVFGNLNALAMEPLGRVAGVGAAVVASLSTFISVPLGGLVGQSFNGTIHAQVGAFSCFAAVTLVAMWWAEGGGSRWRGSEASAA